MHHPPFNVQPLSSCCLLFVWLHQKISIYKHKKPVLFSTVTIAFTNKTVPTQYKSKRLIQRTKKLHFQRHSIIWMQRLNNESALFKTQKSCVKLKLESIQRVISIKIQCVCVSLWGEGCTSSPTVDYLWMSENGLAIKLCKWILQVADESELFTRHVVIVKFLKGALRFPVPAIYKHM